MSSIYNNDINEENQIDKSTTIYPKLMNHQNRAVSSNVTRKKMSISISKLGKRKSFKIEAINLKKNREKGQIFKKTKKKRKKSYNLNYRRIMKHVVDTNEKEQKLKVNDISCMNFALKRKNPEINFPKVENFAKKDFLAKSTKNTNKGNKILKNLNLFKNCNIKNSNKQINYHSNTQRTFHFNDKKLYIKDKQLINNCKLN